MRIRGELRLSVGVLLIVQALTMVAAVALLARMTPAIDRILEENEKSIRAVEAMLVALAEVPASDAAARERVEDFERALAVAKGNITEDSEAPLVAAIERAHAQALARDPEALERVRADLRALGEINRQSMLDANEHAKRLGTAGAWVLVFLGLVGLVLSLALMRRAGAKLIRPVYELSAVLEACSEGDPHRRFTPRGASWEFSQVAEVVNRLVAEHFARGQRSWEQAAKLDRLALLAVLDAQPAPIWVCDTSGEVTAANASGLELLDLEAGGVQAALREIARGTAPIGYEAVALDDAGWLCRRVSGGQG